MLANLVYIFIRLLNFTYRYTFIGLENRQNLTTPFVFATWHHTLIGTILAHTGEKFTMIVSGSKDGELVSTTCEKLGYSPVRGSSTRGGQIAMLALIKNIRTGLNAAITVDGPKGPAKKVKYGVIEVAKKANVPVLPLSAFYHNCYTFKKSWDQFKFPKPFSKITIVIGEPIIIRDLSIEYYADFIAQKINLGEILAEQNKL